MLDQLLESFIFTDGQGLFSIEFIDASIDLGHICFHELLVIHRLQHHHYILISYWDAQNRYECEQNTEEDCSAPVQIVNFPKTVILIWPILKATYHCQEHNHSKADPSQDHHCKHKALLLLPNLWLL